MSIKSASQYLCIICNKFIDAHIQTDIITDKRDNISIKKASGRIYPNC